MPQGSTSMIRYHRRIITRMYLIEADRRSARSVASSVCVGDIRNCSLGAGWRNSISIPNPLRFYNISRDGGRYRKLNSAVFINGNQPERRTRISRSMFIRRTRSTHLAAHHDHLMPQRGMLSRVAGIRTRSGFVTVNVRTWSRPSMRRCRTWHGNGPGCA